ncbi:hypothetical protein C0Z18_20785 [Trinickia dabaoshanensis]|uniref:Uncharacterized protein n=1 Tax=Trinickia dabaoshanensis TaxID=564714 RepID=A0A2N7VJ69_9BURK|nr:hypothetical protein C0Z18_20785 [Trinickia dabaoshanensis]
MGRPIAAIETIERRQALGHLHSIAQRRAGALIPIKLSAPAAGEDGNHRPRAQARDTRHAAPL